MVIGIFHLSPPVFWPVTIRTRRRARASRNSAPSSDGTCACLDIETTGLSPFYSDLTVVDICLDFGSGQEVVQLVGDRITRASVAEALAESDTVYTYNGERFDLPFIHAKLGVHIPSTHQHTDLMHDCWNRGLYGGFKGVERKLGIQRELTGVDGRMAVELWYRYINDGSEEALETLLAYNREDVVNLRERRKKLGV